MKTSNIFILTLLIIIFSAGVSAAGEIFVKVKPVYKIRAYSFVKQPGDDILMTVSEDVKKNGKIYIKKGTPVNGILTEILNTRSGMFGSITVDYFKTTDVNGKTVNLSGTAVKKCENYATWQCFIIFGNSVMTPKDEYVLMVKE